MSEKQELIKELIQMQKEFIDYEHKDGVDPKDYFLPDENHQLYGYRQKFMDMANKVVDLAHEEKGSKRFM